MIDGLNALASECSDQAAANLNRHWTDHASGPRHDPNNRHSGEPAGAAWSARTVATDDVTATDRYSSQRLRGRHVLPSFRGSGAKPVSTPAPKLYPPSLVPMRSPGIATKAARTRCVFCEIQVFARRWLRRLEWITKPPQSAFRPCPATVGTEPRCGPPIAGAGPTCLRSARPMILSHTACSRTTYCRTIHSRTET